ncbi:hypothetical protein ACP275_12G012300 [Erythranthe tilingii]
MNIDPGNCFATLTSMQIINMEPLPQIDRVYAMVSQKKIHKSAFQPRESAPAVGFSVQTHYPSSARSGLSPAPPGGRPHCTHCQRYRHTYDRCWNRLGMSPTPLRGRGRGKGRHHSSADRGQSSPIFAAAAQHQ